MSKSAWGGQGGTDPKDLLAGGLAWAGLIVGGVAGFVGAIGCFLYVLVGLGGKPEAQILALVALGGAALFATVSIILDWRRR